MKQFHIQKLILFLVVLTAILTNTACLPNFTSANNARHSFKTGVLFTFKVQGQIFHLWVTNSDTIWQLSSLQIGQPLKKTLYGPILSGPGEDDHNAPYDWHLDPEKTKLVASSPESCNVKPDQVEKSLHLFLSQIHVYCPAQPTLVRVTDFRIPPPAIQRGSLSPHLAVVNPLSIAQVGTIYH